MSIWIGVTGYNYPEWSSFEGLFDAFLRNMRELHLDDPGNARRICIHRIQ